MTSFFHAGVETPTVPLGRRGDPGSYQTAMALIAADRRDL